MTYFINTADLFSKEAQSKLYKIHSLLLDFFACAMCKEVKIGCFTIKYVK